MDVVVSGKMTKVLAVCVHGNKVTESQYLNTEPFLDAIDKELRAQLT